MSWLDDARRSLQGRLALGVSAGALLVLTISFVALHMLIRDQLYGHFDEDLADKLHGVAHYAAAHPGEESVAEFMPEFRTRAHEDFFQVWDHAGRTLARSDSSSGRDLPMLAAAAGGLTYHDVMLPDGHRGRAVASIIELPADDPRGDLRVVTAEEIENLGRLESRIHVMLLVVALAATVAILLTTQYSVRSGLRPVNEFAQSLETVNPEDPGARLETGPLPSELQPVAVRFSGLLSRLLEALAREKRYARNVAHELRNPLAELRLLADVGLGSEEPAACRAALRDAGAVAAEMERVVDALMALTRYEAGLELPAPEPIELAAELRQQVQSLQAAAEHRGLVTRLELPGEVWVHADSALVRRLLAILVGNAVAHAPAGSIVQLSLDVSGVVTLANPAPHLQRVDVARLGERFYRVGDGDAHAGLGLSLATAIAKVMGLLLSLELRDDGMFAVSVRGFRTLGDSGGPVSAASG